LCQNITVFDVLDVSLDDVITTVLSAGLLTQEVSGG
jgi:hypothetical protein